jgi:hypothetical protein
MIKSTFPKKDKASVNKNALALKRSWPAKFIRPELHLNVEVIIHKKLPSLIEVKNLVSEK